ncbi:MAG: PilZ domain-containing protein [Planctomycetota bacterium]|jgi:hypothetical protein|nr:PilZ domain-containing protein [Planctomycetota bacterium]MDP6839338.1 PilZ domain-containing protein [Planctomycetota bacterium]
MTIPPEDHLTPQPPRDPAASGPQADKPAAGGGAERRRYPRANAEWPITIVLEDGAHQARVRDVSRAGVCFFLDRGLPLMTRLRIELDLPVPDGIRRICGNGAVVRSERISAGLDHYEVAVFLHDMADPDRATVEEYVEAWQASEAYQAQAASS